MLMHSLLKLCKDWALMLACTCSHVLVQNYIGSILHRFPSSVSFKSGKVAPRIWQVTGSGDNTQVKVRVENGVDNQRNGRGEAKGV